MNLKTALAAISVVLPLAMHNQARGTIVSFGSEKDANMIQTNPTNTAGGNEFIGTGRNQNGATRRGLIQFDISSIPSGATINSVSLTLYLRAWSGSGTGGLFGNDRNVVLHQVASEWGDGTTTAGGGGGQGTASAMNGDVSWNYRSYSTSPPAPPLLSWTNPGGDFDLTSSASLVITSATALNDPVTWTGAGLAADVQSWVNGSTNNFGWILLIPDDQQPPVSTLLEFHSRESTSGGLPVLTVDYSLAQAVPEPATWLLVGPGGLLLACLAVGLRRRAKCSQ